MFNGILFSCSRVRPLEHRTDDELLYIVATILARPHPNFTPAEYHELMAINWELRFREILREAIVTIPNLGTGGAA